MKYLDYKEKRKHGTDGFPIAYYRLTPSHSRYRMMPHWHNECEIIRVNEGELIAHINNSPYTLSVNDVLLINSGLLHYAEPKKGCTYECIVFDLDAILNTQKPSPEIPQGWIEQKLQITEYFSAEDTVFAPVFDSISEILSRRQKGYTLFAQAALLSFVGMLLQNDKFVPIPEHRVLSGKKSQEAKIVLHYIALHYAEPITLKELAECVHMNPNYFCRFFKEMTGKTPMTYLNQYRIESACEKLCTTDNSILEVALDCGFNDANYFIKVFKKQKGCTPLQYSRRMFGENDSAE